MNHAEALELISRAATVPGTLQGVQEGSDPAWWGLRDHLADCDACAREYRTWSRLAEAVAAAPRDVGPIERAPATLREATLALVRSSGVERRSGALPASASSGSAPLALPAERGTDGGVAPVDRAARSDVAARRRTPILRETPAAARVPGEDGEVPRPTARGPARPSWWRARWGWPAVAGLATVLAIVALIGALASNNDLNRQLQTAQTGRTQLAHVAATVDHLMQAQDHQVIVLDRADGTGAGGSVIWSPTVGTLVVLSQELPTPPAGMTYRCWVAHQGTRQPVGEMHFEGNLAYWAGPLAQWGGAIQPGDQFGVSLVPVAGGSGGEPVLVGGV